jgi:hypothetical protein
MRMAGSESLRAYWCHVVSLSISKIIFVEKYTLSGADQKVTHMKRPINDYGAGNLDCRVTASWRAMFRALVTIYCRFGRGRRLWNAGIIALRQPFG